MRVRVVTHAERVAVCPMMLVGEDSDQREERVGTMMRLQLVLQLARHACTQRAGVLVVDAPSPDESRDLAVSTARWFTDLGYDASLDG